LEGWKKTGTHFLEVLVGRNISRHKVLRNFTGKPLFSLLQTLTVEETYLKIRGNG
jgi:hypothetical protein